MAKYKTAALYPIYYLIVCENKVDLVTFMHIYEICDDKCLKIGTIICIIDLVNILTYI